MTAMSDGLEAGAGAERPTVFLHIGMMKTGTSFIQDVVLRNQQLLESQGVLFPTDDTQWALQVRAARDVLGIAGPRPSGGAWAEVLARVQAHRGRASLISMEFLSFADLATARRIVAGLDTDDVQVVITARDVVRIMPSAWQSMMKQGHPWSFDEFVRSVTGSGEANPEPGRRFWRHHDLVRIAERWTACVGPDRMHVVTVPPSGAPPDALWQRFAATLGLPTTGFDTTQDRNSNFSLSFSDTELVRQINLGLDGRLSRLAHKRWATRYLANRVMRSSAGSETSHDRPALGAEAHAWAVEQSRNTVTELERLEVQVHGDLADLLVQPRPDAASPTEPAREYPDRAALVIAELLVRLAVVDPLMPDGNELADGSVATGSGQRQPAPDEDVDWTDDPFLAEPAARRP